MGQNDLKDMAMLDLAEKILRENNGPLSIYEIIARVNKIKNIDSTEIDKISQFYLDITSSAKFVYCGDDLWDTKEGNLELWDKESYTFNTSNDILEGDVEDDIDFTEFILDEEDIAADKEEESLFDNDEEIIEEKEYIDPGLELETTDEDNVEESELEYDSYDEDDYNDIMNDYEDMYDK